MANNRMFLVCTRCAMDEDVPLEKCCFFLAKYYPTTGWYVRGGKTLKREDGDEIDFVDAADTFFGEHKHGGMYGEYMLPVFEDVIHSRDVGAKRDVLAAVQIGIDRASNL